MTELRQQLADTPARTVVANHCYGMFELAALHLSLDPPKLDQARLAIDALALLVEGLATRLGEEEANLREGLTQLRLAFVRMGGTTTAAETGAAGGSPPEPSGALRRHRGLARSPPSFPRWPATTPNATRVPTAMVRLPSAMAVQWNGRNRPSSVTTVPSPRSSSNVATLPVVRSPGPGVARPGIKGRSWTAAARGCRSRPGPAGPG